MSTKARESLSSTPLEDSVPKIGHAIWMLKDSRNATGRILEGISPKVTDWQPLIANSISAQHHSEMMTIHSLVEASL